MHSKVQILGLGPHYLPVVYDILLDNGICREIVIFTNLGEDIQPVCSLKEFPYTTKPPGTIINKNFPCVFGVSGAKNKVPVFNYFMKNHEIEKEDFLTVIDRSSVICSSAQVGFGCFIEQNVSVSSQSVIGFGVSIKRNASIGHHSMIGDFVDINPGVTIPGKVIIGNNCTIGVGAVLLDDINIGENSFIGAGSVVTRDIPSGVIAFGNPCKVIRKRTDI